MSRSEFAGLLSSALLGLCCACSSPAPAETAPAAEPAAAPAAEPAAEPAEEYADGHAVGHAEQPAEAHAAVHWSYEGETGPAHWGALAPEYALCAEGHTQSPIDVRNAAGVDLPNLELHYAPTPIEIENTGHSIQVNYAPGSYMQLDGVRYDLAQFHFHSPSEHTVDGKQAAAEMHLVHKSADGELAVLGVLIDAGVRNGRFDPIWKHLPAQAGPAQRFDQTINVADLLPSDARTFRYTGSLTTPPGTEGVHWNLMIEPVTVSQAQIDEFRAVLVGNNRPVQELNGRTIQRDTSR